MPTVTHLEKSKFIKVADISHLLNGQGAMCQNFTQSYFNFHVRRKSYQVWYGNSSETGVSLCMVDLIVNGGDGAKEPHFCGPQ